MTFIKIITGKRSEDFLEKFDQEPIREPSELLVKKIPKLKMTNVEDL